VVIIVDRAFRNTGRIESVADGGYERTARVLLRVEARVVVVLVEPSAGWAEVPNSLRVLVELRVLIV
jgi:hypothetical protein